MKKVIAFAGIIGGMLLAPVVSASMITQWGVHSTAAWNVADTVFSAPNPGHNIADANNISWGNGTYKTVHHHSPIHHVPQPDTYTYSPFGTGRSGLELTHADVTGSVITNGANILTQAVTHHNHEIQGATLLSTVLDTYLTLTPQLPFAAPGFDAGLVSFGINFKETDNIKGKCIIGSVSICDDIFVLTGGALATSFHYDGYTYTLTASEATGQLHALLPDACAKAGVAVGCIGFTTPENANTTVQLQFDIKGTRDVPEPAPLALLGLGLFALFSARNRKNS